MILIVLFIIFMSIYLYWENKNPVLEKYELKTSLKQEFRILHISDLHNYNFGKNQSKLKNLIIREYDYIFITGDLIDRRYTNINVALELIEYLVVKYPGKIYFVAGNHEKGSDEYFNLRKILNTKGIKVLEDENLIIENINIIGLEDPSEYITINKRKKINYRNIIEEKIKELKRDGMLNILLCHRPEYFDIFVNNNIQIVFSGHTHGGQVRIFNKGIYSPSQGLFGKYSGGIFREKNTVMFNSRGLGNNFPFVFRVFNRPHITDIKLITNL